MRTNKNNNKLFIILALVLTSIVLSGYFGNWLATKDFIEDGLIVKEGNETFKKHYKNYYDVDYSSSGNVAIIKIHHPCVEIYESTGGSMKPYWEDKSITIVDTCYPLENLKIGDVIIYYGELDSSINPHHRIIDIDYEKRWVQTQGDNPETNSEPDDFVSFDRILGKDIGVLNILEDKKIVKEEVIDLNELGMFLSFNSSLITFGAVIQTCVCSSTGFLELCDGGTEFLNDTFITQNDLKEEYCDLKNEILDN